VAAVLDPAMPLEAAIRATASTGIERKVSRTESRQSSEAHESHIPVQTSKQASPPPCLLQLGDPCPSLAVPAAGNRAVLLMTATVVGSESPCQQEGGAAVRLCSCWPTNPA